MRAHLRASMAHRLCILAWLAFTASADVFAHYMVGTVDPNTDHARRDIEQARAMGFRGFALNLGQPGADWAINTTGQLFSAAEGTDFSLFFSLDTHQEGNLAAFGPIVQQFASHPSYHRAGPNGYPLLSTFGGASTAPESWTAWLAASFGSQVYFVPNLDDAPAYYADPSAFLDAWAPALDGLFGWETAWPPTQGFHANASVAADEAVASAARARGGKAYMVPLSPFQYKHLPSQGLHWYRAGEANFAERMALVLALDPRPELAQVLTWNDAGEGHYVSDNLWAEGIPQEQLDYADARAWPHAGWGGLVAAFNAAFDEPGADAAAMRPPPGTQTAVGAMWHRAVLRDAACASDPLGKPDGWQAALDAVSWAVVLADGADGYRVRLSSGGEVLLTSPVGAGLNYGSVPGMRVGAQRMELLDGQGNVVLTADGTREVAPDSDGICNFNYQVAGLG